MLWSMMLLSVPTVYEIISDVYEWRKGERDKKKRDVIIRGLMMTAVSMINCFVLAPEVTFWQSFGLSVGLFVLFFDYIMGIYLTKNPFFLGTTSQTDMFWKFIPWYIGLLMRGTVFAISFVLYKHIELIRLLLNLI